MKIISTIFPLLVVISVCYGSLIRTPSLDHQIVRADSIGRSFSYSTSENHAFTPISRLIPITAYNYALTPYQNYLNPYQNYPIYTPILGQYPIIGQNPGYPIQQNPIQIGGIPGYPTYPSYPGVPIQQQPVQIGGIGGGLPSIPGIPSYPGGIPGVGGGLPPSSPPPSAGLSPTPVQGTVIDDDTVAVDAA